MYSSKSTLSALSSLETFGGTGSSSPGTKLDYNAACAAGIFCNHSACLDLAFDMTSNQCGCA
eukprot:10285727-Prorocentrum_lima.AAC.1